MSYKTYYELLDTKEFVSIFVQVKVTGVPRYSIKINNECCTARTIELTDCIKIQIELLAKANPDDCIILDSIRIDDFEIIPGYIQYATYDNAYTERTRPTCMLGAEGVWTLEINEPFYRWRHRVTHQGWLI